MTSVPFACTFRVPATGSIKAERKTRSVTRSKPVRGQLQCSVAAPAQQAHFGQASPLQMRALMFERGKKALFLQPAQNAVQARSQGL